MIDEGDLVTLNPDCCYNEWKPEEEWIGQVLKVVPTAPDTGIKRARVVWLRGSKLGNTNMMDFRSLRLLGES
jgi:hypothetical protein